MLSDRCLSCPVCLSVLSVTLVYLAKWLDGSKMKLGVVVGLGPGHIVLDGDPAFPLQKGHSPQFAAHVRCGQTAGWIKMPLSMEVCLGPGDFVLDGDTAPPKKGAQPAHAIFCPCILIVAGCKTKFSVKFVISALENVYRDVLHANMNQKN